MKNFIKLDPWFITGFTDAEGCFSLSIVRNKELKIGWSVRAIFQLNLSQKDKALLEQMKSYFGVGGIHKHGPQSLQFRVESVKDFAGILNHFDKYPLISQKYADYTLFKRAYEIVKCKKHLTVEGLKEIVAIKASMNWGLSEELKTAFPDLIPVPRPSVVGATAHEIKDPHWLSGFTTGEGCWSVDIKKSSSHRLGEAIQLWFRLTQHERDKELMISLVEFWGCGGVFVRSNQPVVDFKITKLSDLLNKVLPVFQKYPLQGVKSKDFEDFCKVAKMMKEGKHLTPEGLDQIRKIKAGMNRGR